MGGGRAGRQDKQMHGLSGGLEVRWADVFARLLFSCSNQLADRRKV